MPLPDERRGRRASELVSLFQQRIDTDATDGNSSLSPTPLVRSISRGSQGGLSPHSLSASLPSRRPSSVSNELKLEQESPVPASSEVTADEATKANVEIPPAASAQDIKKEAEPKSNAVPKQASPVRAAKKHVAQATFPRRAASESTAESQPAVGSSGLKRSVNSPTASFLAKNRLGASPKTTKTTVSGTSSASTSKLAETSSLRRGASRSESNGSPIPRKPIAKSRESPLSKSDATPKPRTSSTLSRPTAASATRISKSTVSGPAITKPSDQPKPHSSSDQQDTPKRPGKETNAAPGIPKDSPAGKVMSKARLGGPLAKSNTPKLSNPGASPSISAAVTKRTSVTSRMGPIKKEPKKEELGQAANVVSKARIGRPGAAMNKPVGPVGKVDLTKKKRTLVKPDEGKGKEVEAKAKEAGKSKDVDLPNDTQPSAVEDSADTKKTASADQEASQNAPAAAEESQAQAKEREQPKKEPNEQTKPVEEAPANDTTTAPAIPVVDSEMEAAQHPRAASDPQPTSASQAESADQGMTNTFSTLSVSSSVSPPPSDMPDMETDNEEDSRELEGQPSTKPSSSSESFHRSLAPSPSPTPQPVKVGSDENPGQGGIPIIVDEVKDTKRFNEWGSREGGAISIPAPARSVSPAVSSPAGSQKKVPIWMRKGGAVESTSTPSTPSTPASPLP